MSFLLLFLNVTYYCRRVMFTVIAIPLPELAQD